ncbi:MAG TPA: hypothetical protein VJ418_01410 [Streptosporangiaceae bacterium]|jgi:hypothetical protein|nr:hypothetical protein [Streptosporangiaceae bacterium]
MNQQASDPPRSVQIIGRYWGLIGLVALLGALVGVVFAALNPPASSSRTLVVFEAPTCPAGAICGGPMFSPAFIEAMLLKQFPSGVQVKPVTGDVVSISVAAGTAARAEAIAQAAARSYIVDTGAVPYMGEYASAQILQPATSAAAATPLKQVAGDALLGAVLGALLGIIAALAGSQTIIDSPALPRELDVGAGGRGAGQPTRYATTHLSLQQLAREDAQRRAAPYSPLGG